LALGYKPPTYPLDTNHHTGLFTGKLLQRFGVLHVSSAGTVLLLGACATLRLASTTLEPGHFIISMMLCGLGWNFCFSAGTLMLAECHLPEDATRMQAANDALVFGFSAIGTFVAGEWAPSVVLLLVMSGRD
jgi:MFS family permease